MQYLTIDDMQYSTIMQPNNIDHGFLLLVAVVALLNVWFSDGL